MSADVAPKCRGGCRENHILHAADPSGTSGHCDTCGGWLDWPYTYCPCCIGQLRYSTDRLAKAAAAREQTAVADAKHKDLVARVNAVSGRDPYRFRTAGVEAAVLPAEEHIDFASDEYASTSPCDCPTCRDDLPAAERLHAERQTADMRRARLDADRLTTSYYHKAYPYLRRISSSLLFWASSQITDDYPVSTLGNMWAAADLACTILEFPTSRPSDDRPYTDADIQAYTHTVCRRTALNALRQARRRTAEAHDVARYAALLAASPRCLPALRANTLMQCRVNFRSEAGRRRTIADFVWLLLLCDVPVWRSSAVRRPRRAAAA